MARSSQTVLITGANGDIGRQLALQFAQEKAQLALCDLSPPDEAAPFHVELKQLGVSVLYGQVDVTDATAVGQFVDQAASRLGGIDVCVVNAGIVERGPILELSVDAWRRTIEVNLTGAFLTAQAAGRVMLRNNRGGQIVFISSWVQDVPKETIGAYCASKGGLKMLAKCMALELGPLGIRVNLVAPGWVDAGLTGKHLATHPERLPQIEAQIPLGRLATSEEVAAAVRMLCSDEASYVHGATLLFDGGSSLCYRKVEE
jgi:NAD(P)-dependent dehydrogenase (short-subunit alcohol dehydrogenase family)